MRRSVLVLVLLALLAGACTRTRPTRDEPLPPPTSAAPEQLAIAEPASGDAVSSPVVVSGTVADAAGRTLAAVVYRSDGDVTRWQGNGPLAVADDGSFAGVVTYTLPTAGPGIVEVVLVDPVGGTVLDRVSVPVELQAAP